jgi:hypothetical protein
MIGDFIFILNDSIIAGKNLNLQNILHLEYVNWTKITTVQRKN